MHLYFEIWSVHYIDFNYRCIHCGVLIPIHPVRGFWIVNFFVSCACFIFKYVHINVYVFRAYTVHVYTCHLINLLYSMLFVNFIQAEGKIT